MNGILETLVEIGTFIVVTALAVAGFWMLERRLKIQARLAPDGSSASMVRSGNLILSGKIGNPILAWVRSATLEKSGEEKGLRRKLALAGFDNPSAPVWYVLVRLGCATIPPLLFVFIQAISATPMTGLTGVLAPVIMCLVGFIAPQAAVDNLANGRRSRLLAQFPDVLDLLMICMEAGSGLEGAIVRVSQETQNSHPEISRELVRLSLEVGAGRSRDEALQAMGERTDVQIIRSFASVIAQSDALGVSVGQALRTFAAEMREGRLMSAEEKAMRIPVLMTIPLVGCILPVIMASLLLPAVIDVIRTLTPALSNH